MAAHLGGLATGFVCGLLMTLVSPADARSASGIWPAARRMAVAAIVALGLAGLAYKGFTEVRQSLKSTIHLAGTGDLRSVDLESIPSSP
jgi:hypothetical protein